MATHRAPPSSLPTSRHWLNWFLAAALLCVLTLIGIESRTFLSHSSPNRQVSEREVPRLNVSTAPGAAPDGMVWVPGGEFWMGSDSGQDGDEKPVHKVYVDGFWMDRTEVTNAQFAQFVEA